MTNSSSAFSSLTRKKRFLKRCAGLLLTTTFASTTYAALAGGTPVQNSPSKTAASAPSIHTETVKQGDPAAEAEIDKRFNANPNTRGLRNILYAYIPDFLKQCPTWASEMQDWHRCEAVVPVADVVNFRNKLRKEPLNTRIQQWFFLDAIGGIERPKDDMVRAKSFLSKYFAKIILHELHDDNGWCYGPSWVGHSQKSWMPCAEIPPFASRTLPQWALYTPPKNHPRPTWPGTFDDTAPEPTGPMEVPEKVIEQAAKPKKQNGNLTRSYKGEDDNLASLPALPAHKAPVDPSILLERAQQIAESKDGATLLKEVLTGNPAERQQALKKASELLHMSQSDVAETARALKSSPQGMLILQQIQQLADSSPAERQQSIRQVAGLLGVRPEAVQQTAQTIASNIASQTTEKQTPQQLMDQAKKLVSDPDVLQKAQKALQNHASSAKEIATSSAGQQALQQASDLIQNLQSSDNSPQPAEDDLNKADTGVFELDKHSGNRKEANAGGERDLLSYRNPDEDRPGISENNFGNSEDRNSAGAQNKRYGTDNTAEETNFADNTKPANNPAEDGVAPSNGSVDMSGMSSMPESLPTPETQTGQSPSPFSAENNPTTEYAASSSNSSQPAYTAPSGTSSTSWQNEAFGGSNASPYGDANFATKEPPENRGEDSPPPPQNVKEMADQTEKYATGSEQKAAKEPEKQNLKSSTHKAEMPVKQAGKWKIISEDDHGDEDSEWKVIKR